jgi:uncharacterized protein YjbJ (UPF0337 family)
MGDRTQRLKGKLNQAIGRTKATAGYRSGRGGTELKGDVQTLKGETQSAVGRARRKVKNAR